MAAHQVDQRRTTGGMSQEHGGEGGDTHEARDEEGAEHVHEELSVAEELVVPVSQGCEEGCEEYGGECGEECGEECCEENYSLFKLGEARSGKEG